MAPTSRAMLIRFVATSMAVLGALGFLVGCAGGTSPSSQTSAASSMSVGPVSAPPARGSSPTAPTALAAGPAEARPGCASYCQSAGQYGAPGEHGVEAVAVVSTGTITVDPDGFVPLTLTCNLPVPCNGAIQVCIADTANGGNPVGMALSCGRADEALDANATQTIGVGVPTYALGLLRSDGSIPAHLTVDNENVPDCQQIPQLAAQCAKIVQALPVDQPHGDGIIRLISADFTLAPAASGAESRDSESASLQQLQQTAAADRGAVEAQFADHWVPQLSSKRPGVADDGFTWDNTLTWQEFQRLRQRYGARLLSSGDWSTFDAPGVWVTIAPVTFDDSAGALGWCTTQGFDADHCAAKLISTTHPVAGSFAHN